ncbi:MAG: L-threonylcarbamoyladenylate synthase [Bacteroidota bacterium]|nr:L-threonylcarbamoyladenylate synthase [Bacteroidota bacterium]MDP4234224.1 L-threonylcarbamoyladenylate synthase [Bacteroidota bacterium]MDP4243414.1 L-threonylcarbamoyladenylate synthase [Bacteroidota bacterium]MDP4288113.1 L-threonylcarbamoyladenylate synthase [Bacteroidota bacterium]
MTTEIGIDVAKARALLERGLVVAIPTETVYGLAANALDTEAVLQIFEIKRRPRFDPLIVHGASPDQLTDYVRTFPEWAVILAERFWPGPLTLVLPKRDSIPDIVTSGLDAVALRVPNHPMTLDLLSQLDFPIAAPSANPFGYVSPTSAEHVLDQLGGEIPYILDGGECIVGLESTIVTERDGEIVILRLGGVAVEDIESLLGPVRLQVQASSNPIAPGGLESHYAPRTPLKLGRIDLERFDAERVGILSFQRRFKEVPIGHQVVLSPEGSLHEAAKNLFGAIRYLDSLGMQLILAEPLPELGLGRAINDRLRRASAKGMNWRG